MFTIKNLDKILIFRLAYFALFFLVTIALITYNVFGNKIGILLAILGFSAGMFIGIATGRVFSVRWHKKNEQVIATIDKIGWIILVPYLIFTIFRQEILEHWLKGNLLTSFTFSLLAGIMLGRVIYLVSNIIKTLQEEGVIAE